MSDWQPIETCPENTYVLTWHPYFDDPREQISVTRFRWVDVITEVVESESRNASGRRRIVQEKTHRERNWEGGGGPSHWMSLPDPPPCAST